jgi:hypothetical protein
MSARIFHFPKRARSPIRVVRDGDWLITDGENGHPCNDQAHAIAEALKWARECGAAIIIIELR